MPEEMEFNSEEVNKLIDSVMHSGEESYLRTAFEKRLHDLEISENQAVVNLEIEYRTLQGILDGNLKRFDILSLFKIGHFLELPEKEIMELYTKFMTSKHRLDLEQAKRRTFILSHFDLPVLKTVGIIQSIRDFDHIEQQLNNQFSLQTITEYNTEETGAALSSTSVQLKSDKTRKFFKNKSRLIFELIANPNNYDKQALVEYFPQIRGYSMDFSGGLVNVIKTLYKLGVTVIYQPKMPSLQMRGATFSVNDKPCIVLTDYRGTYPTLWFALLHELFHVLFDWEEILVKRYHLSIEENDLLIKRQKEDEANEFAREFLFPGHKIEAVDHFINKPAHVREFAADNHVHPSIVYANYAFAKTTQENNLWIRFDKSIRPPISELLKGLGGGLSQQTPARVFANYFKTHLFNTN